MHWGKLMQCIVAHKHYREKAKVHKSWKFIYFQSEMMKYYLLSSCEDLCLSVFLHSSLLRIKLWKFSQFSSSMLAKYRYWVINVSIFSAYFSFMEISSTRESSPQLTKLVNEDIWGMPHWKLESASFTICFMLFILSCCIESGTE